MGRFAKAFAPYYERISSDIFEFCEAINYEPSEQQRRVLEIAQAPPPAHHPQGRKRVAVKSGKGPGKTRLSCAVAGFRALQYPDTLTIVTAPTQRQVRDIWLSEFRQIMEQADPILKEHIQITKSKIEIAGRENWAILPVTASHKENAQGYHRENMTVIVEEASGVDREIIDAFKETLSNPNSFLLLIGNPNTRDCAFFDCFNSHRDEWETVTLNAEETPKSRWFDPERNREIEREYGRDSDPYRVAVLGEFPNMDPNCVVSSEDLEKCTKTDLGQLARVERWANAKGEGSKVKQFGIDLARYGSDESVIYQRCGNAIVDQRMFSKTDPADVVDHAYRMQSEWGWTDKETHYVVDASGMGQGIMHKFHRARKQIHEFHNGGTAQKQEYANKITEAWFTIARMARAGELHIPNDNKLIKQLSGRQYHTNTKGKLILETKDEYKDRGNESPDRADAFVMAFYDLLVAVARVSTRDPSRQIGIRTK